MESKQIASGILRALLTIAAVSLLLMFLFAIKPVLIYLGVAAVLSLVARPLLGIFRQRLKLPNAIAVLMTMSLFILFLFGLISLFIPLVLKQSENLSLLNSQEFKNDLQNLFQKINTYFSDRNIDIFEQLKRLDLLSTFNDIPNLFNSVLGGIGSVGIGLFSVLFISFFLLKDTQILHNSLFLLIPESKTSRVSKSLETIKDLLSRYFIGLILQITILFVIYSSVLLIFGIENAIVIALLCALLNLIPYIGPLIGGVLMLVLTMTENLNLNFQTEILPTTLYVMLGYAIAQLIDNFLSQPLIFSKSVKSHPLEIFLVILIAGLLFGVLGMVLAVPVYTVVKVVLKEFLTDNKIVKSLTQDL
ncbi:AI-2E family transporter [Flavicella sp.]|nr:AI-2E family transporter [Flavicella sp.]MDA9111617.1 AI-2E family transporter [Flavicella sp.]